MKIFKTEFIKLTATKHTCLFISSTPGSTRVLSESASLGSHFRENLQQAHFSVVLPISGLISLQKGLLKRNKLNFMMKYHFDFLPTKLGLAIQLITTEIWSFLYNWVESFSVGYTAIHTWDLKYRVSQKLPNFEA